MKKNQSSQRELVLLLEKALDSDQLADLLRDLLTDHEMETIITRWRAFGMLLEGYTHREVQKKLGISISKVTHAANLLKGEAKGVRSLYSKRS